MPDPAQNSIPDWQSWSSSHRGARFTDWLRAGAEPAWNAATGHRFTRELIAGQVSRQAMIRYLVQDYAFIDRFVALLGAAILAAPSLADRLPLGRFLGMIASDENTYFIRAFDALGVREGLRSDPPLSEAARSFQELMAEAASSRRYEDAVAVLVVAEWVYLSWALPARDTAAPEPFWCREWVDLHANPYFEGFVDWLRGQLDRDGPALDMAGQARVMDLFRRATSIEAAFFDTAYDGSLPCA
jgi:thiaminase/transcriptional activator TenA